MSIFSAFLYPVFLWALLPLSLLLLALYRRGEKSISIVHTLILILLIFALARPIAKQVLQPSSIDAKEILIALDVSYSMKATDIAPTRYDFAKEMIQELLTQNPSDNVMLIAFTTNPLLLSPPTTDHRLISVALESLNLDYILTKGTSLENLFKQIALIQARQNNGSKQMILISDGGEESHLAPLLPLIHKSNINLHIVATGSTQGTTIETPNGEMLKDKEGHLVISRINPLLKSLAKSVKGSYFEVSSSAQSMASKLNDAIQNQTQQNQKIEKMQVYHEERYLIPLLLALFLFLMLHTRGIKYLIVFFALFGFSLDASIRDDYYLIRAYSSYHQHDFNSSKKYLKQIKHRSLQSQMTLAHSHYRQREFKKALALYRSIHSTDVPIKQQLYYHIANTYSMMQQYSKARIYYAKALQLGEEKDALYNLKRIALLKDKDSSSLGIAHPKSQSSQSSKSETKDKEEDKKNKEDQPSSGSGGGEKSTSHTPKKKKKLHSNNQTEEEQPLGSKVYELINKGYIRETQPW